MVIKQAIKKYVDILKRLFVAFSVVVIPSFMVCLVYAFTGALAFCIIAPALGIVYLVVYAFYALKISMGTVIGTEITDKVVHLKTKRKTFTYDVRRGCVDVKVKKNKFIATFQTQDSRDKFVFLRRFAVFGSGAEQFTVEDIRAFYPALDEETCE
ncbi:MAG: hypothetical protein K2N84_00120 [Clostridia bacterium]|nr:hypothetical protein [Clostridia bacterium]